MKTLIIPIKRIRINVILTKLKFILIILFLSIQSCSEKNIDYDFQIINNTNYYLDEVNFSFIEDNIETIDSNTTSNLITLKCTGREIVSSIHLDVQILSYSNSDSTFTIREGITVSREVFSTTNINSISINLNTNSGDDIFCIKREN